MGARTHHVEMLAPQVRRQRAAAIAGIGAAEGLPGEVVVVEAEAAGQTLEPGAQHVAHVGAARQRLILRRRNAQAIERQPVGGGPAHRALVEQGRHRSFEELPLLFERAGHEEIAQVDAIGTGNGMADADEAAEHAMAVGIAGEDRDPPAAPLLQAAALPIVAARRIEIGRDQPLVGGDIGLGVGGAKEAVERLP